MKSSEFKIFISVESYDEKTAENYRNCYVAEKHIVFNSTMKTWIKIVSNFTFLSLKFREISRQKTSRLGRAGSCRFIVLNESASPKMIIKNVFYFFPIFFKGFIAV